MNALGAVLDLLLHATEWTTTPLGPLTNDHCLIFLNFSILFGLVRAVAVAMQDGQSSAEKNNMERLLGLAQDEHFPCSSCSTCPLRSLYQVPFDFHAL